MSVVQFPHVITLGFWSMFIPVDWTVKNRTTNLVTFNQTLTSSALELSVLEWNFFEETFCKLASMTNTSVNLGSESIWSLFSRKVYDVSVKQ